MPTSDGTVDLVTRSGDVRGVRSEHGTHFFGIPYAAAPVGRLRYAAPQPREPWVGVLDATSPRWVAHQGQPLPVLLDSATPTPAEDALRIDVHVPVGDRPHPILIWLHGGGFVSGAPSAAIHDPRRLAAAEGIIVVSVGYRLGAPGWVPLQRHVPEAVTNAGLLDQLTAIDWVREHASALGGDPDAITLGGHSAGAMSAATLACAGRLSARVARLFCSSGAAANVRDLGSADLVAERFVDQLRARSTDPVGATAQETHRAATLAIRSLTAGRPSRLDQPLTPVGPVIDGTLIEEMPSLSTPTSRSFDWMIGFNRDDAAMLFSPSKGESRDGIVQYAEQVSDWPEQLADEVLRASGGDPDAALHRLRTDVYFADPARRLAASASDRAYHYDFAWRSPLGFGACHGIQVPFFMDNLADAGPFTAVLGANPPGALAESARRALGSFVRTGRPGADLGDWPCFGDAGRTREIGGATDTPCPDPAASRRSLLRYPSTACLRPPA